MRVKFNSLAYQTDLAMLEFNGVIKDRGNYVVAETPSNPSYYWGNLLVFRKPPAAGDLQTWSELFRKEFAHQTLIRHMTFGWDDAQANEGELRPFLEQGFEVQHSTVLIAGREELRTPPRWNPLIEVRALQSDEDWELATLNQVACRQDGYTLESYLQFKRAQMTNYRRMSDAGFGHWFGAFLSGKLVGDCGLFVFDGIGRFQSVGTHPDFRRQGVCATFIDFVSRWGVGEGGARKLVMVAEPDYHAIHVYESVGFKRSEKQIGLMKAPPEAKI